MKITNETPPHYCPASPQLLRGYAECVKTLFDWGGGCPLLYREALPKEGYPVEFCVAPIFAGLV